MKEHFERLDEMSKLRKEDVKRRTHEMLFLEIADYDSFLPEGVVVEHLLPLDLDRTSEREERSRFIKQNATIEEVITKHDELKQREQSSAITQALKSHAAALDQWLLQRDEIFEVLCNIASWTSAAGLSFSHGVDR